MKKEEVHARIEQVGIIPAVRVVVRQIVVHRITRISFSMAEVLRFGIAC